MCVAKIRILITVGTGIIAQGVMGASITEVMPGSDVSLINNVYKNTPECGGIGVEDPQAEIMSDRCIFVDGRGQYTYLKSDDIPGFESELHITYFDDKLLTKEYEVKLGQIERKNAINMYSGLLEYVTSIVGVKPEVGRYWSSVAIDRAQRYNDFHHVVDVARKVERWEPLVVPISEVNWNTVNAYWKLPSNVSGELSIDYDSVFGSRIRLVFEAPEVCAGLVENSCFIRAR